MVLQGNSASEKNCVDEKSLIYSRIPNFHMTYSYSSLINFYSNEQFLKQNTYIFL